MGWLKFSESESVTNYTSLFKVLYKPIQNGGKISKLWELDYTTITCVMKLLKDKLFMTWDLSEGRKRSKVFLKKEFLSEISANFIQCSFPENG